MYFPLPCLTKENNQKTRQILQLDSDSENFVAHSLKQKFVGCGAAIRHAIEILPSPIMNAVPIHHVLEEAYIECQFAADRCHLASVKRQLQNQSHVAHIVIFTLHDIVAEWQTRVPSTIVIACASAGRSPPLAMEWELAWLLVTKLTGRGAMKSVEVTVGWLVFLVEVTSLCIVLIRVELGFWGK